VLPFQDQGKLGEPRLISLGGSTGVVLENTIGHGRMAKRRSPRVRRTSTDRAPQRKLAARGHWGAAKTWSSRPHEERIAQRGQPVVPRPIASGAPQLNDTGFPKHGDAAGPQRQQPADSCEQHKDPVCGRDDRVSAGDRDRADILETGFARIYLSSSEGRQATIRHVPPEALGQYRANISGQLGRHVARPGRSLEFGRRFFRSF